MLKSLFFLGFYSCLMKLLISFVGSFAFCSPQFVFASRSLLMKMHGWVCSSIMTPAAATAAQGDYLLMIWTEPVLSTCTFSSWTLSDAEIEYRIWNMCLQPEVVIEQDCTTRDKNPDNTALLAIDLV